ncbi:MAG: hypothetical protein IKQ56_09135 [Lachnospiraceae bacterium]|nr:hypothetical protein [Lachnospiraceae bacterium]
MADKEYERLIDKIKEKHDEYDEAKKLEQECIEKQKAAVKATERLLEDLRKEKTDVDSSIAGADKDVESAKAAVNGSVSYKLAKAIDEGGPDAVSEIIANYYVPKVANGKDARLERVKQSGDNPDYDKLIYTDASGSKVEKNVGARLDADGHVLAIYELTKNIVNVIDRPEQYTYTDATGTSRVIEPEELREFTESFRRETQISTGQDVLKLGDERKRMCIKLSEPEVINHLTPDQKLLEDTVSKSYAFNDSTHELVYKVVGTVERTFEVIEQVEDHDDRMISLSKDTQIFSSSDEEKAKERAFNAAKTALKKVEEDLKAEAEVNPGVTISPLKYNPETDIKIMKAQENTVAYTAKASYAITYTSDFSLYSHGKSFKTDNEEEAKQAYIDEIIGEAQKDIKAKHFIYQGYDPGRLVVSSEKDSTGRIIGVKVQGPMMISYYKETMDFVTPEGVTYNSKEEAGQELLKIANDKITSSNDDGSAAENKLNERYDGKAYDNTKASANLVEGSYSEDQVYIYNYTFGYDVGYSIITVRDVPTEKTETTENVLAEETIWHSASIVTYEEELSHEEEIYTAEPDPSLRLLDVESDAGLEAFVEEGKKLHSQYKNAVEEKEKYRAISAEIAKVIDDARGFIDSTKKVENTNSNIGGVTVSATIAQTNAAAAAAQAAAAETKAQAATAPSAMAQNQGSANHGASATAQNVKPSSTIPMGGGQPAQPEKKEEREERPHLTGIAARSKAAQSSVLFDADYGKQEQKSKTPWWKKNQR